MTRNKCRTAFTSTFIWLITLLCLPVMVHAQSGGVVLWNKLGSAAEVTQSEIGPPGTLLGGSFVPGVFGGAYSANQSERWLLRFSADMLPTARGTIEFWAKLTGLPASMGSGGGGGFVAFTSMAQPHVLPPGIVGIATDTGLAANDGCGGGGLFGRRGLASDNGCHGIEETAMGSYGSWTYEQALGTGTASDWHHYAFVWDEDGIPAIGGRRAGVYLDGQSVSGYWLDWAPMKFVPFPAGNKLALVANYHDQGSVAMDNIIIWDVAKTDFSSRFNENPCEGVLPKLSALITNKSGPQNARLWTIALTNKSYCPAENAQIDGLTLTQTYGAACAPIITTPASFPLGVGNILPSSTASGTVTVDFTGCPNNARFSATIPFSANNGAASGSKTLNNQFR